MLCRSQLNAVVGSTSWLQIFWNNPAVMGFISSLRAAASAAEAF
jgi:hypothetical protein